MSPVVDPTGEFGGNPTGEIGRAAYQGGGIGHIAQWKCPACGVENNRRLELGCQSCGSGRPGTHVGQAPPATAEPAASIQTDPSVLAYEEWWVSAKPVFDRLPEGLDVATLHPLLKQAFLAGYGKGLGYVRTMDFHSETLVTQTLPEAALPFPVEGKVARTLAAALELFIEQVLADTELTDDGSDEWCSAAEARALITQLEAHTNG